MELRRDTEKLFNQLEALYQEKRFVTGDRQTVNEDRILYLESEIRLHCEMYYKVPWVRLYCQWKIMHYEINV